MTAPDELTPNTLRREGSHSRECRRYIVGRANTSAADCTCWIGAYASVWAADRKRIEVLEKENRALRANVSKSVLRRLEDQGAFAAEEKALCDCVPGHLCELHAGDVPY